MTPRPNVSSHHNPVVGFFYHVLLPHMSSLRRFFPIFILVSVFAAFFISHRSTYLSSFDPQFWLNRYQQSTYVKGDKGEVILSDAEYYRIRGYLYLKDLVSPADLAPSHPPLGQYLLGLSIFIYGNPFVISFIFGAIAILLIFLLALKLSSRPWIALLVSLAVFFEPMFNASLTDSMLDLFLLVFSLATIYYYLRWLDHPRFLYLLLSQFMLGLSFATKFFPTTLPLFSALMLTTLFTKDFQRFKSHIVSLIFIPLAYLLGHFTYFFHQTSLLEFFRFQRYINAWWAGSPQVAPFSVWDLIYFNRWHTWWGSQSILPSQDWWAGWPILISAGLLSLPLLHLLKRRSFLSLLPLYATLFFSLILFSFEAVYPRHLFLVLPLCYLLLVNVIKKPTP